jgi:uncharacterized membrane protein
LDESAYQVMYPIASPAHRRPLFLHFGRDGPEDAAEMCKTDGSAVKEGRMSKGRLEAFSDGVLAVIITIMVLEMKSPRGSTVAALRPVLPVFLSYLLSFVYIGIYWNNHHHLLHATQHVNGATLWANLHLLFWLSLIPFTTAWMDENHFESWPVAVYGMVLLLAGIAYFILTRTLISLHGRGSTLATSIGRDQKGKISIGIYAGAVPLAFVHPWIAAAAYIIVAIMWLIPDPRIERKVERSAADGEG